jgi:hypothetical protein
MPTAWSTAPATSGPALMPSDIAESSTPIVNPIPCTRPTAAVMAWLAGCARKAKNPPRAKKCIAR